MDKRYELDLHPLDYPFGVKFTSNFEFNGIIHFRDDSRLVLVLTSPCCDDRLLQKTTPPTCLSCDRDWSRFTDLDPNWREYYYPSHLYRVQDSMAQDSFIEWLRCPLDVLSDHFTGQVLADALAERFRLLRNATNAKFGTHEAWRQETIKRANTSTYGSVLDQATKDLWAEKQFAYAELLQQYSGDLLLTAPPAADVA